MSRCNFIFSLRLHQFLFLNRNTTRPHRIFIVDGMSDAIEQLHSIFIRISTNWIEYQCVDEIKCYEKHIILSVVHAISCIFQSRFIAYFSCSLSQRSDPVSSYSFMEMIRKSKMNNIFICLQ